MRASAPTALSPSDSFPAGRKPERRDRFALEIGLVLLAKAVGIGLLWYAFFSVPAAPGGKMSSRWVAEHVVTPAARSNAAP
jgi:hypothetical protein